MTDEHFKIRQTVGQDELPPRQACISVPAKPFIFIDILWSAGSFLAILVNLLISCIVIRDMLFGAYNPVNHFMLLSVFVSTLLGIACIHTYIVKR